MIDLHSHILPGLDDGARTLEESLEIARAAEEDGIAAIAATPHVRDDYPTSPQAMEAGVRAVRDAVASAGIRVELYGGGELALEQLARLDADAIGRFALAGSDYVLVEMPYTGWPLWLDDQLFRLRTQGYVPVLAHPERNVEVQTRPERLGPLIGAGVVVQVTAGSVDGRLGRRAAETAMRLVHLGYAHLLASDAHTADVRAIGMKRAADRLGDRVVAEWLTREAPGAVIANRPLRAPPRIRRGLLRRVRRS